jgi:hypothetical protein
LTGEIRLAPWIVAIVLTAGSAWEDQTNPTR